MVGTRGSTPEFLGPAFDAAVQRVVDALLPGLTTRLTNEIRQNGARGSGDQPPTISLDLLAPQPLQLMSKTGLLTLRRYSRFWDVLRNSRLGWQVTSWKEMLLINGRLLNKPKEYFPRSDQQKYEREYHTIRQRNGDTSSEFMKRFRRLTGFMGKKAGPPKERAKHFKWALCDWILDGIVNMEFTDVAQVANAARNIKILHERHGGNSNQTSCQNRGQQYNRSSGSSGQKGYPDYASSPPCDICGKLHLGKACHRVTGACFTYGATHSVVSVSFTKHISISPTLLNYKLSISTPMKSLVIIDHEYQNCPLRFDDKIRSANLFPLDMNDFDIILFSLFCAWMVDLKFAPLSFVFNNVSSLVIWITLNSSTYFKF
ncbi:hypothetical protein Tco_1226189 [Tanacetum coccineum]